MYNDNLGGVSELSALEKVQGMMNLQAQNNDLTRPDWRTANFNWMDAIMVEGVEAFDSLSWKWWKKGEDDLDNCKMELVDIWHFLMSWAMVKGIDADELTDVIFAGDGNLNFIKNIDILKSSIRSIIAEASQNAQSPQYFIVERNDGTRTDTVHLYKGDDFHKNILIDFSFAIKSVFGSMDEFVKLYVAKNALNRFRQSNGYKEGTYVKIWTVGNLEKEDNHFVHLYLESVVQIPEASILLDNLLSFLDHTYNNVRIQG